MVRQNQTIGKKIRSSFVSWLKYQVSDMSPVIPKQNYDPEKNIFYINSEIGLIVYRPRTPIQKYVFRDKWLNKFEVLIKKYEMGENIHKDLNRFYHKILLVKGVRYKANFRSRMRLKVGF